MVKRVRAIPCLAAALAVSTVMGFAGQARAQRTTGATAGSLVVDDSSKDVDRSSCVLMLRRGTRTTGTGAGSAAAGGLVDLSALTTAMTTTGLIDPAARSALGLGPREWPKVVRIEVTSAGAQAMKLSVSVNPAPNSLKQAEPAGELLRELIKRAKAVVNQSVEARRQEVKASRDELEKRRMERRELIENLRKRLRDAEASGFRGVGVEPVASQRQQIESELAAKRPRLEAIKKMLPRFTAQTDEMGNALRGLVAAREALVAVLENAVAAAKGSPVDLFRARAELAEARVRAAEWSSGTSSFSPSRNVREELAGLEVDIAALEARLKALPANDPVKPPVEDAQQLRSQLFRAENENNSLEMQYQQIRRDDEQLEHPPTLVVLDGQPQ